MTDIHTDDDEQNIIIILKSSHYCKITKITFNVYRLGISIYFLYILPTMYIKDI